MDDHFQAVQDRIEGILVLLKTSKSFEDKARLLGDLRLLLDETDQMLSEKTEPESPLPKRSKAAGAD
jgi:hypothetical protein